MIMPDHVHVQIVLTAGSSTLGEWVKAFKAVVGRGNVRWQAGFFDHVLRSEESAEEKRDYIRMNPVRAGLVSKCEDWPYAGFFDSRTGQGS